MIQNSWILSFYFSLLKEQDIFFPPQKQNNNKNLGALEKYIKHLPTG